jgi:CRP-like cAMP-binding protein
MRDPATPFDPDAVLMVQGEASDYAMLILEGEVTVSADSARSYVGKWVMTV